jgi:hypothetical protein
MPLFRRKGSPPDDATPIEQRVTAIAREVAAEAGFETVALQTADPLEPVLVGDDGYQFALFNLIVKCRDADPSRWKAIARGHIGTLIRARREAAPAELDRTALLQQVRTRVVPASMIEGRVDLSYAHPVAPGLVLVICIDYPETVTTLNSADVVRLAAPVHELFAAGLRNTAAEPIDEHERLEDGVWLAGGSSLFVASKIADPDAFRRLTGEAPHGVVFSVPNRSMILYTTPIGAAAARNVTALARFTAHFAVANADSQPGGVLSPMLYYVDDENEIEDVGAPDADGGYVVRASGRFGAMLESLAGESDA